MADTSTAITQNGSRILKMFIDGIDGDNDVGDVLDIHDYELFETLGYPKRASMQGRHTAGATDTISAKLHPASVSGDIGATSIEITDVTDAAEVMVDDATPPPAQYWQVKIYTVGVGNTLEIIVIFEF